MRSLTSGRWQLATGIAVATNIISMFITRYRHTASRKVWPKDSVPAVICYIAQCCTIRNTMSKTQCIPLAFFGSHFTVTFYLAQFVSLHLHPCWQKYIAYLETPPSAASVSCTLSSYRTGNIYYDKWSQQSGLCFALHPHPNSHMFTGGNQSIHLCPAPCA